MILSHYALVFSWPEDTAFRLLYSTRTGAVALVPAEIIADLENGNTLDAEFESTLGGIGLLVVDRDREKRDTAAMVRQLNSLRTAMNVSVIANLHCNFSCRYCYEGNQKGSRFMSEETAGQLITFVKNWFQPDMTRLTLDFYGGKPLLSVGLIRHIAGSLKPFVESQGAVFEMTLVTNGSLLTPKVVERLLPLGLKRAKITIDGPPEIHNYFRPYRSGRPSFDTIIKNVRQCCELLKIGLNGNFTRKNYRQFPALFDYFESHHLTPEKLHRLSFSPVLQVNDEFSAGFCGGCASCNEEWLAEAAPFLRQKILNMGYRTDKISPSLCMVDVDNSFVVHYDGSLYQCVALIGHEAYACGDVWSGMKDYSRQYHLDHWRHNKECLECSYLPLCFGGCRYMALQREDHMAGVDCSRDFFDAALETFVRQDVGVQRV